VKTLYLNAEDLAKGHVLWAKGGLSGEQQGAAAVAAIPEVERESSSAATLDIPGTYTRWLVYSDMTLTLMAAESWRQHPGEGEQQRFVVSPQLAGVELPETAASSSLSNVE
jgi:hypothetical protein